MKHTEDTPLVSAKDTARLLGITLAQLDGARRNGCLHGEPFRERWWHISPQYRYSEAALQAYEVSLSGGNIGGKERKCETPAIVRLANAIITQGIESGASDIHIEPYQSSMAVRLRINGVLHEVMAIPQHIALPLTVRYLQIAGVTHLINHRLYAQAGNAFFLLNGDEYAARLSFVPTPHGVKTVIRLLGGFTPVTWQEMGMHDGQAAQAADLLRTDKPGLTVLAMPHGEGMTTAFRQALRGTEAQSSNIYQFDDVADFPATGFTCILLDPESGMTVAIAAQSAIRQGATLLVFPGADRNTARVAVEVAESGFSVWVGVRVPGFAMNAPAVEAAQIITTRFRGFGIDAGRFGRVWRGAVMGRLLAIILAALCTLARPATAHQPITVTVGGANPAWDIPSLNKTVTIGYNELSARRHKPPNTRPLSAG